MKRNSMAKSRKIYVLQHDRTVISHRKSIKTLIETAVINDQTEWVLIPIQESSATYIAVSGDTILQNRFATADIRYHMRLKMLDSISAKEDGLTEEILKDYYTTTITATSVEELYNAIHNLLFFYYVREVIATSDLLDYYWFMEVADVEITLRDGLGKKIKHFLLEDKSYDDDCPFNYTVSFSYEKGEQLLTKIAKTFGLIYPTSILSTPNLYFKEEGKRIVWGEYHTKIDLYSTISRILCTNPYTKSLIMLKMKEMDALLKVHAATMYIQPIDLYDFRHDAIYDRLPIAHDFNLPKYELAEIDDMSNDEEHKGYIVQEHYGPMVLEVFSFDIYDPEDYAYVVDNIGLWMQVYHEGASAYSSALRNVGSREEDPEKLDAIHRATTTVFATIIGDINDIRGTPAESQIVIYTDIYEDEKPNIKETCAILAAQEKLF